MAITSWPRVDEDTTDAQYAELFDSIIGSGVRDAGAFAVTADSSGLNVKVATGFAVVAGSACLSTAVETLAIAANTGTVARVDTVVLQRNFTAGAGKVVQLIVKQGTQALVRDVRGIFEVALATITVAPSAATITSANVVNKRGLLSTRVGTWTTATRPTYSGSGLVGLNTDTGAWEANSGNGWAGLATWDNIGRPSAIPISQGGTGAKTKADARAALGITSGTAVPSNTMGDDGDIYFQKI
jgi:hypothetical protein